MYSYIVREPFGWKGLNLTRGAVLTDEDARELEDDPQHGERLRRCNRIKAERLHLAPPEAEVAATAPAKSAASSSPAASAATAAAKPPAEG